MSTVQWPTIFEQFQVCQCPIIRRKVDKIGPDMCVLDVVGPIQPFEYLDQFFVGLQLSVPILKNEQKKIEQQSDFWINLQIYNVVPLVMQ